MHRNNYKVFSPKDYFRIVLASAMIPRFNSEIDWRLSKFMIYALKILQLVPAFIVNVTDINALIKKLIKN